MQPTRRARLSAVIQEEVSQVIRTLKDPRVSGLLITVTRVELTPDAGMATVFFSLLGEGPEVEGYDQRIRAALGGLESASGLIRRQLAGALTTRTTPALQFREDRGLINTTRVHELLKEIEREKAGADAADSESSQEEKA